VIQPDEYFMADGWFGTCFIFQREWFIIWSIMVVNNNGYILAGGLEHDFYEFPYIGNVIIPTDFHIFQGSRSTTN
jgi:hypothetical protein